MSTVKTQLTSVSDLKAMLPSPVDPMTKMSELEQKLVEYDKALAEVMGRVYIMEEFLEHEFVERVKDFRDLKVKQFKKIKDADELYIEDQLNKTFGLATGGTKIVDMNHDLKDEKK